MFPFIFVLIGAVQRDTVFSIGDRVRVIRDGTYDGLNVCLAEEGQFIGRNWCGMQIRLDKHECTVYIPESSLEKIA